MNYDADIKRIPEIAEARTRVAKRYRDTRKTNPALARLLFKRTKSATIRAAREFWNFNNPNDCFFD
jgi:hypothetical protein